MFKCNPAWEDAARFLPPRFSLQRVVKRGSVAQSVAAQKLVGVPVNHQVSGVD